MDIRQAIALIERLQPPIGLFENETLNELVTPSDRMAGQIYYHGTAEETRARLIIENGIQPQNQVAMGRKAKGMMTPVANMVYVTPNLRYGLIYAIGGVYLGEGPPPVESIERRGRYGFLFEVPGDALGMVQPDEDDIGGAARFSYKILQKRQKDPNVQIDLTHSDNRPFEQALLDDEPFMRAVVDFAGSVITPRQADKLFRDYEFAICAQAGKKMVTKMSPAMKQRFIEKGCHIAHQGGIRPTAYYRIDKLRSKELGKDGENLAQVAERIELSPAVTG